MNHLLIHSFVPLCLCVSILHFTLLHSPFTIQAAEPPSSPILRIDPGMHTAMIRKIATDASGSLVLTCSDDKTAKLWSLSPGKPATLLRTLRIPIGEGNEGKLFACALSPDGKLAALGGFTTVGSSGSEDYIYLFDTTTGQMTRRISGLPNITTDLAFSANTRWLAASLGGSQGLRLFEVSSGRELARDTDYGDRSYSVDWQADQRLVTTSYDGKLRLYRWDGSSLVKERETTLHQGKQPETARFSPDGQSIAVGFDDSTQVAVLRCSDLSLRFSPATNTVTNGHLSKVAWNHDGSHLAAGGIWDFNGFSPIRQWPKAGEGKALDSPAAQNLLTNLRALPPQAGGGFLFAAADPAWGQVSESGQVTTHGQAPTADFRDGNLQVTADGKNLAFPFGTGNRYSSIFRTESMVLREETPFPSDGFEKPKTTGLPIENWKNQTNPSLKGQAIELLTYETARSLAIARDDRFFLLGCDYTLRCIDAEGRERWQVAAPRTAMAVNLTANDQLAVAAFDDGTIRWYLAETGQELLAFFPHADRKRWVLWAPVHGKEIIRPLLGYISPKEVPDGGGVALGYIVANSPASKAGIIEGDQILSWNQEPIRTITDLTNRLMAGKPGDKVALGVKRDGTSFESVVELAKNSEVQFEIAGAYFTCSPGAEELIGWHVNRGPDQAADFFPCSQLYDAFYRPDIVTKVIAEQRGAGEIAQELGLSLNIESALKQTPEVKISGATDGEVIGTDTLQLTLEATDTGGGLKDIGLFHNGKRVPADGPPSHGARGNLLTKTLRFTLALAPGENEIRAQAANDKATIGTPAELRVQFNGVQATSTLHIFTIGLNRYQNPRYNLTYCVPDADASAAAFTQRAPGLFADVKTYALRDDQATKPNIAATFAELAQTAQPQDLFVFCYAGHGVMGETVGGNPGDNEFYLIPHDITRMYGDPEMLAEKGVSKADLEAWCAAIPARKQLMLLDTCQSGGLVDSFAMRGVAEEKAIAQLARSTGTVVIASTGAEAYARESKDIGHGIFTRALLDGIAEGKADADKDGKITVKEIDTYIGQAVPELSQKLMNTPQYPTSYARGQDFPIGIVK